MKKKIGYGLLIIIIVIQFFRIDKNNPAVVLENDFITITNPPEEITTILKTTCYDCHSNETKYPWYTNVAPISWWVKHHINEGREELNFSNWGKFKEKRKDHKLEECYELIEENEMPMDEYTWTHSEAKLNDDQKSQLINWFVDIRKAAKERKAKKELHLNNGAKWEANSETTGGINTMLAIASKEIEEGRISLYIAMAEQLNIEMKNIFKVCTMKGEAHEQLHLYLQPLVKKMRDLENAETEEEAIILQKDILKDLNNYTNFFE